MIPARRPAVRMALLIIASLAFLAFLALALGIVAGANHLVVPKRRSLEERHEDVLSRPAEYGMSLEPFTVTTADGWTLRAFLAEPVPESQMGEAERTRRLLRRLDEAGHALPVEPRGTVVFLHGRGGLKENMLTIGQRFVAANYRCIVYDARAHGESEGRFCTYGQREKDDLSRVLDQVERILDGRGETLGPVAGFGLSLGGSVLLQALEEEGRIEAAVVVAAFADLREIVRFTANKMARLSLPCWIPDTTTRVGGWRAGFDPAAVRPMASAGRAGIPVFIAHGARDGVIPVGDSRQIANSLRHPRSIHREVPEGYHFNVLAEGGDDLYQEMVEFVLAQRPAPVALAGD